MRKRTGPQTLIHVIRLAYFLMIALAFMVVAAVSDGHRLLVIGASLIAALLITAVIRWLLLA